MTRRLALVLLGTTLPLLAADESRQQVQVTHTDRFDLTPGGTLRLNATHGNVYIEAWDQPAVEITVVKITKHRYLSAEHQRAVEQLDLVRIVTEHGSQNEVSISMSPRNGRRSVNEEYTIRAPRDTRLSIRHTGGYLLVSGIAADIDATNRFGDIMLMLPDTGAYSIDAKNKFGGVYSDFSGTGHNMDVMGKQFVRDAPAPAHRLFLRMGMGGITIVTIPPKPLAPPTAP